MPVDWQDLKNAFDVTVHAAPRSWVTAGMRYQKDVPMLVAIVDKLAAENALLRAALEEEGTKCLHVRPGQPLECGAFFPAAAPCDGCRRRALLAAAALADPGVRDL